MGSGASKKKAGGKNASSFDENEEDDVDPFLKATSKRAPGQPRLEQAGILPKLEPADPKTTHQGQNGRRQIVGLIDSDDDEIESVNNARLAATKGQTKAATTNIKQNDKLAEKQLKSEIIELEKTFESLEFNGGNNHNSRANNNHRTNNNQRPSGFFHRSAPTQDHNSQMPQPLSYNSRPRRSSNVPSSAFTTKPLKFSWEDTREPVSVDKDTEEWTYKQVKNFNINTHIGPCHLQMCRLIRQNLTAVVGKLNR
jgi:hypothetical protein